MFKLPKKQLITFAILFFLLLVLVILTPAIRSSFLNTLKQPLNLVTYLRRETGAIIFYHRNFLQSEWLQKENDSLRQRLNSLSEVFLENSRLKNLLIFKQQSPFKVIVARVIARSADSWSSAVVIDKGSRNGIRRGMSVITYSGFIGRIIDLSDSTS